MYSKEELIIFSILNTYYKEIGSSFLYKIFKISYEQKINIFKDLDKTFKKLEEFLEKEKLEKFLKFFNENLIRNLNLEVEKILELCKKNKIKILTYEDKKYYLKLKEIKNPPYVLYYKGKLPNEDRFKNSVALVGTRNISSIGEKFIEEIAEYLERKDIFNISGLALGADTLGHKKTLGITGAVLGQGLAKEIYPRENKKLAEEILENNGFLLSELPPLENISAINLIKRNRMQSALADSLIIAETYLKGGTVHTFKYAREQKKEIYISEHNKNFIEKYKKDLIVIKDSKDLEKKQKEVLEQSKIIF